VAVNVRRTRHVLAKRDAYDTLEQRFRFEAEGATAAAIIGVLLTAPLLGEASVFGSRPGTEGDRTDDARTLKGFSPAPGFRFDVDLTHEGEGTFIVRFSQPDRAVPYLEGGFVWTVGDGPSGAVFDEQINTEQAMEMVDTPLGGDRASLRRWLFFRVGHQQVMRGATRNIAAPLAEDA
jgi:hypothetical protein